VVLPLAVALAQRVLVLDGGLSTELERRGHDLSGELWSARLLRDAPEAVVDVHAAFLRAGADVITTASYQASVEGFERAGLDRSQARRLIERSVRLARRSIEEGDGDRPTDQRPDRYVAGSVGPYGAMLADGSEYTGDYGPDVDLAALRNFHRPRIAALTSSGVDVLALETVPSMVEAEALIAELVAAGGPGWLSMTTVIGPDGRVRTRRGELAEEAFALAAGVSEIVAVGVNCTQPRGLDDAVRVASKASGKPVVVYPNSGEGWDAGARAWIGDPVDVDPVALAGSGARLVGGCCRVGPDRIARIATAVRAARRPSSE
jgi:homocysteine S-methyltransferase